MLPAEDDATRQLGCQGAVAYDHGVGDGGVAGEGRAQPQGFQRQLGHATHRAGGVRGIARPLPGQGGGIEQRQRLGLRGGRGDAADQVRGLVVVAADYHHVLGAAKHPRQVRVAEVRENRDAPTRQPGLAGGVEVADHHDLHPCLAVGVVAGQRRRLRTVADHDDVVPAPFGVEELFLTRENGPEDFRHRVERDDQGQPACHLQGQWGVLLGHVQGEQLEGPVKGIAPMESRVGLQPAPRTKHQRRDDQRPEQVQLTQAPVLVIFHGHTNLHESPSRFHDGQFRIKSVEPGRTARP